MKETGEKTDSDAVESVFYQTALSGNIGGRRLLRTVSLSPKLVPERSNRGSEDQGGTDLVAT